nr:PREDICTED: putative odorant receptor 98b [Fopius arisanus]
MMLEKLKDPFLRSNFPPEFEKLFNVCRIALRASGILAINSIFYKSKETPNLRIVYYFLGILPVVFVFICETLSIIHFWGSNVYLALEIATSVLSGFVVIVQGFCMYYSRESFLDLIASIRDLWKARIHDIDDNAVRKVKAAHFFTQFYAILVIALASSYTLRPFCLLLGHIVTSKNETYDLSQTAYPAIYPFRIDSLNKYVICISVEFLIFISVGAWWIAADMVFLQLATHLSLQYQILNDELMTLATQNGSSTASNNALIHQLDSIGKRHTHLLLLSKKFHRIFSPILLVLMLVTSANICICIINLQEALAHRNYAEVNKCVVHTAVTMIQPAIYCIYADELVERVEETTTAAYECAWVGQSQNFQKSVRLVAMCAQKGLNFRTFGFFNVDLTQLTQVRSPE